MMQEKLFKTTGNAHGGTKRIGRRKIARPVVTKRPMHLILKSDKAIGKMSFLRKENSRFIQREMRKLAKQFGVCVMQFSTNGNHLHLAVKAQTRGGFKSFLRAFAGHVAQFVTKAKKGKPFGKFWTQTAFTRVVEWGRDLRGLLAYIVQNQLEAHGMIAYMPRGRKRTMRSLASAQRNEIAASGP